MGKHSTASDLALDGPGEAVGLFASVDVAGYFQGFQIDDGDVVVGGAADIGAGAVGLHFDAGRAVADLYALYFAPRGHVENGDIGQVQGGDQDEFSVGGELQAVGALHIGGERLDHFLGGDVEDGDGAVLSVGGPEFLAIGGDVEAFGASAHGDHRLVPIASRRAHGAARTAGAGPGRCSGRRAAGTCFAFLDEGH